jgi:hypothetical protein
MTLEQRRLFGRSDFHPTITKAFMKNLIATLCVAIGLFAGVQPATASDRQEKRQISAILDDVTAKYNQASARRQEYGGTRRIDGELAHISGELTQVRLHIHQGVSRDSIYDELIRIEAEVDRVNGELRALGRHR